MYTNFVIPYLTPRNILSGSKIKRRLNHSRPLKSHNRLGRIIHGSHKFFPTIDQRSHKFFPTIDQRSDKFHRIFNSLRITSAEDFRCFLSDIQLKPLECFL